MAKGSVKRKLQLVETSSNEEIEFVLSRKCLLLPRSMRLHRRNQLEIKTSGPMPRSSGWSSWKIKHISEPIWQPSIPIVHIYIFKGGVKNCGALHYLPKIDPNDKGKKNMYT